MKVSFVLNENLRRLKSFIRYVTDIPRLLFQSQSKHMMRSNHMIMRRSFVVLISRFLSRLDVKLSGNIYFSHAETCIESTLYFSVSRRSSLIGFLWPKLLSLTRLPIKKSETQNIKNFPYLRYIIHFIKNF